MLARGASPWTGTRQMTKPRRGGREFRSYCRPFGAFQTRDASGSQGLAPLANNCRPVPGLGTRRLGARNHREVTPALILTIRGLLLLDSANDRFGLCCTTSVAIAHEQAPMNVADKTEDLIRRLIVSIVPRLPVPTKPIPRRPTLTPGLSGPCP